MSKIKKVAVIGTGVIGKENIIKKKNSCDIIARTSII